jgi:acyl-CoA synthetase (AMP-forming)/AMP-acid ligase II
MTRHWTGQLFDALEGASDELAYEFEGQRLTWADLDLRARAYANALSSAGVSRGDRVAVFAETCLEQIIALFGNYFLGAIHVPINTRYRPLELAHILADSEPAAVIVDEAGGDVLELALARASLRRAPICVGIGERSNGFRFTDLLDAEPGNYIRPRDEDPCLIIYTSGTTGPSKGVVHTHDGVIANTRALTGLWTWSRNDRLALALPLFHVHGLCVGIHGAAIHGMTVLLERRFDVSSILERFGEGSEHKPGSANLFMGVPTMYAAIIEHLRQHPEAAARLARGRLFCSGSAALSPELWHAFVELTGHRILERYGMTETLITLSNPFVGVRVPGSVGQPVPGCDAAVVDENGDELEAGETGELIVHSNGIMTGYWNLPKQTEASFVPDRDGRPWFLTGDVAFVDEDGNFHLVGRSSIDILKSGGFKISAIEIEGVLARHPTVREVAIVGVDDPKWGQKVVACVVTNPVAAGQLDDPGELLDALIAHHRDQLADFKRPRGLYLCDQLPRNAMGKVQKHLLLEAIATAGLVAER